jgi:serine/threonine protein kinase
LLFIFLLISSPGCVVLILVSLPDIFCFGLCSFILLLNESRPLCFSIVFLSDGAGATLALTLDAIPSAAVSAWAEALQHNTHLTKLNLSVKKFDVADVHAIRTALRLNTALTDVTFDLGGVKLSTTHLLPCGDRRRLRAVLGLDSHAAAADGAESDANVADARFFVPLAAVTIARQLGRGQFGAVSAGTCRGQPVCIKRFLQHAATGDSVSDSSLATVAESIRPAEYRVVSQTYFKPPDDSAGPDVYLSTDEPRAATAAVTVNQQQAAMRMQINELALLIEFGDQGDGPRLSDTLQQTCVFATHFSIDSDNGDLLVIMPLMPGGVLESALATAAPADCVRWMLDVAEALCQLHRAGFVHRDLASRNVLLDVIDGVLTAKLCDFGLSCAVEAPWLPELAPLGIWPPEAVLAPSPSAYGTSGDVWAFGLMLVDVLRGGHEQGSVDHAWLATHEQPELNALLDGIWAASDASVVSVDLTDLTGSVDAALSGYHLVGAAAAASAPAMATGVPDISLQDQAVSNTQGSSLEESKNHAPALEAAPNVIDTYQQVNAAARFLAVRNESDWRERMLIPHGVLDSLPSSLRSLVPVLAQWCTRVDALQRPSMELVVLLLCQAHRGPVELNALPEQVVPGRLAESHWTLGDGALLGAICRRRGIPLDLGANVDLKGSLGGHEPKVSDGGEQLLGGLLYSRQVSVRLLWHKHLGLLSCHFLGFFVVYAAMQWCPTSLDLSQNRISAPGAAALSLPFR